MNKRLEKELNKLYGKQKNKQPIYDDVWLVWESIKLIKITQKRRHRKVFKQAVI